MTVSIFQKHSAKASSYLSVAARHMSRAVLEEPGSITATERFNDAYTALLNARKNMAKACDATGRTREECDVNLGRNASEGDD